ncbi:MAG: N-ethylammeline chlorohydrolase [Methanosphaera sp. rholeuAM270]|nr:MAG: N-ethylammeline chlorohydrolase [Methanosphaera sp. rholeuAM270]
MTETKSILIKDTTIISNEVKRSSILIVDDTIQEVSLSLNEKDADKVIDASNKITIPGLINTHSHAAMTLLRGVGDDQNLQTWLNEYIWPKEANLNDELVYLGSKLAMAEMIKTGTTTFNDMYFFMEETAKAVDESGIRAVLGYGMIDLSDDEKRKSELKKSRNLIKKCHNTCDNRVKVAVSPHAPYTCSEELLIESNKLAQKNDLKLHIHVSETKQEVEDISKEKGSTPFKYLDDIDFLNSDTIAAHGVWTTDEEMKILKEKGVTVAHNPSSNTKLASGIAPVHKYLKNDINVSIGTDGVSSNNNLDMFSEMKLTALLQKVKLLDPTVLPTRDTFNMATVNGAKALGLNAGVIEEGKLADIVIVDTLVPHMTPLRNALSNIIYSSLGTDVETVICNGEILLENKKLLTINEQEIIQEVNERAFEL